MTAGTVDLRKKQFALLLHVVNQLQGELEQEAGRMLYGVGCRV